MFDIIVQWVSICLIVFSKMLEQDQTSLIINQEGRSTLTKIKQDPQMLLILSFEKYTIVNEILNARLIWGSGDKVMFILENT